MKGPHAGVRLSDIAEGGVVIIEEGGVPVEFYVAKHDYEPALNGAGRTLLVRKNAYDDSVAYHSSTTTNHYYRSDIHAWLCNNYARNFDKSVRAAMGTTNVPVVAASGSSCFALECAAFLLSVAEFGLASGTYVPVEGSKLSTASLFKDGKNQWTRSRRTAGSSEAVYIRSVGDQSFNEVTETIGIRPCFTLPESAVFDHDALTFKGVR